MAADTFAHPNPTKVGLPPEARSVSGERRVVNQNIAGWNRIAVWLRQLELVRSAA